MDLHRCYRNPKWAYCQSCYDELEWSRQRFDIIREQKMAVTSPCLRSRSTSNCTGVISFRPQRAVKGTLERVKVVKSRGSKNDGKPDSPPSDAGGKGDGGGNMINQKTLEKLDAFRTGVNEIVLMEQVILIQFERVKKQRELEKSLGFPLPDLWREIEQITKLGGTLVNLKADLGLDGYLRVPRMIHGRLTHDMAPRMLAGLSDHDRQAVAEFGKTLTEPIRKSDGSYAEKE